MIYELHIGTFTQEGTLYAAIERLDHLVELGITRRTYACGLVCRQSRLGYDGVALFAVLSPGLEKQYYADLGELGQLAKALEQNAES